MRHAADEMLLGFGRALRAAGVPVTPDRTHGFLEAVSLVGLDDRRATYLAGRATLCAGPDDLERYDQVFEMWFGRNQLPDKAPQPRSSKTRFAPLPDEERDGAGEGLSEEQLRVSASTAEVLRHRDIAALTSSEKALMQAMMGTLKLRPPRRRTARHEPWHHGAVDAHRTLRSSLRRMGEPAEIAWRRRRTRPRRLVLLVDVSGSMSEYADALLRLCHRLVSTAGSRDAEVFTVGTRLTRVTRALRQRDPERAIIAAGETVPDWSGGTRLGETLRVFLDRWGARGMARGSVVVVFSDGWERGDASLLAEQMDRLHHLAHRVVWVNPHRGKPGYEPVQQGVLAALPHVDDFLAGHSLATFAELLEVVAHA